MKTSKIDRVVEGLKAEVRYLIDHTNMLEEAKNISGVELLQARTDVVNELLTRLAEVDEPEAAPKRTRKARKAGLPDSGLREVNIGADMVTAERPVKK